MFFLIDPIFYEIFFTHYYNALCIDRIWPFISVCKRFMKFYF